MESRKDGLVYFEDFSQEELRTLQLRILGILEAFDTFCKEHHLRYYLTGGTCIGAIRHHGIIPWDDDLDVAMPRDDYETLFRLWDNDNNRYKALRPSKNYLTGVHIGQIRDSETTCIYDYASGWDICHGIKIDVEPIDGCPDRLFAQKLQRFYCLVYGLLSGQRIPNHGSHLRKIVAKVVLSVIRSKDLRYKMFSAAEQQVKKYKIDESRLIRVAYLYVFPREVFGEPYMAEFEGKMYPLPQNYDAYLKRLYGDYMQFPPIESRKPVTKVRFYDPDTSYERYRGTYFCEER